MHFYSRQADRLQSVVYGYTRMRIGGGVDYYRVRLLVIRLLNNINERALVVRLEEFGLNAVFLAARADIFDKVVIGLPAVDIRLSYSEHIHVGTVDNINLHFKAASFRI